MSSASFPHINDVNHKDDHHHIRAYKPIKIKAHLDITANLILTIGTHVNKAKDEDKTIIDYNIKDGIKKNRFTGINITELICSSSWSSSGIALQTLREFLTRLHREAGRKGTDSNGEGSKSPCTGGEVAETPC